MSKADAAGSRPGASVDRINAAVGRRIRAARLERGMSLGQLGGSDLSRSFLSQVERGRSRISLRALGVIAERLELPISYFFEATTVSPEYADGLRLDRADAALAYSLVLHQQGDREGAVHYALRAVAIALRGYPSTGE